MKASFHSKFAFIVAILAIILVKSHAQNTPLDYVAAHNNARSLVRVGPTVWNNTLAAYAQRYANIRAADCQLVHSDTEDYGENIAVGYNYYGAGFTGVIAVKLWVDEKPRYDYPTNSCRNGECGHYTQVVWRDSVQIGCARVICKNGGTFITCNYYPPGNYEGERPY